MKALCRLLLVYGRNGLKDLGYGIRFVPYTFLSKSPFYSFYLLTPGARGRIHIYIFIARLYVRYKQFWSSPKKDTPKDLLLLPPTLHNSSSKRTFHLIFQPSLRPLLLHRLPTKVTKRRKNNELCFEFGSVQHPLYVAICTFHPIKSGTVPS